MIDKTMRGMLLIVLILATGCADARIDLLRQENESLRREADTYHALADRQNDALQQADVAMKKLLKADQDLKDTDAKLLNAAAQQLHKCM